jgi:hypothetical protein
MRVAAVAVLLVTSVRNTMPATTQSTVTNSGTPASMFT